MFKTGTEYCFEYNKPYTKEVGNYSLGAHLREAGSWNLKVYGQAAKTIRASLIH